MSRRREYFEGPPPGRRAGGSTNAGVHLLRYGLVALIVWFGAFEFTAAGVPAPSAAAAFFAKHLILLGAVVVTTGEALRSAAMSGRNPTAPAVPAT